MFVLLGLVANIAKGQFVYTTGATVTSIDGSTNAVNTLLSGVDYIDIITSLDGSKIYVSTGGSIIVYAICGGSLQRIATIPTKVSNLLAISPDGTRLYTTSGGAAQIVSVVDIATNSVTATINVGNQPIGVKVSPDGTRVYVANFGDNTISVINTATNTVVATVSTDYPTTLGAGIGPRDLAISPDGSKVYIINTTSGTVSVLATATNTVISVINAVSPGLYDIVISPDGTKAYITTANNFQVRVLDLATNTIITNFDLGVKSPLYGIVLSPDGTKGYVNVNGTVKVIDLATNGVSATLAGTGSGFQIASGPTPPIYAITTDPSSPITVCEKGSKKITAIGASDYTWEPATGLNTTKGETVVASPTESTTYVVSGTAPNGCTISLKVQVNVSPAPVIASVEYNCATKLLTIIVKGGTEKDVFQYSVDGGAYEPNNVYGPATFATPSIKISVKYEADADCQTAIDFELPKCALPVTWASINASSQPDKYILIAWQTASESQNKGFEVERSSNAKNFERIGFVAGANDAQNIQSYRFIDAQPLAGINYYRLKQLDNGGTFAYSRIVAANVEAEGYLKVYPNPAAEFVAIESGDAVIEQVRLLNVAGQVLKTVSQSAKSIKLSMSGLSTGTYFAEIQIDGYKYVKKIVRE